jgi:cyclase
MQQITKNVFAQAEWRGANTSIVVTSDGVVLIDVPPDAEKARKWALEAAKKGPVRYVINTESHHDHWITNSLFDGVVVAHQAARDAMAIMDHEFIRGRTSFIYTEPLDFPDSVQLKLPEITFTEHMTIRLGEHTFQLIHTPGHTLGQVAVYIPEEKVLFPGDTVLNGVRTPFHDAVPDHRWLDSIKVIEDLDVRFIVTGHGPIPVDKAQIKTQKAVVQAFLKAVGAGKTKGTMVPSELHRSFDPFYDGQPRGVHPGGVVLAPIMESKKTGKHGELQ